MSCYVRHMNEVIRQAGLNPQDKDERKKIDLTIRRVIGEKEDQQCNLVWKEVKNWLNDEKKYNQLVQGLKEEFK